MICRPTYRTHIKMLHCSHVIVIENAKAMMRESFQEMVDWKHKVHYQFLASLATSGMYHPMAICSVSNNCL